MKFTLINFLAIISFTCILQNAYALKPSKTYEVVPDTLKLPYEKNVITTSDGVHLKSWTFLPSNGDKHVTLVMAYADAGNMSWWIQHASLLSQFGYTVVMFDYRGFGESDDFTINKDMLYYSEYEQDLVAVMQFAKKKYPKNKTGIWAFSMGTIITTLAAETAKPAFIIGDGFITSPMKVKEFYAPKENILLPGDANTYDAKLAAIKAPMLIFSGKQDKVATDADIQKLKKSKPAVKVVSFDGGHLMGLETLSKEYYGSQYVAAIDKFLGEVM